MAIFVTLRDRAGLESSAFATMEKRRAVGRQSKQVRIESTFAERAETWKIFQGPGGQIGVTKIVLTMRRVSSIYDDGANRYHFPRTYLKQVESAVDDLCVYYEPRRTTADGSIAGGIQAYFAIGRIVAIQADFHSPDMFYATVTDYLDFDHPVPFRDRDRTFERQLTKADGSTNRGAFGRSVRQITDYEFESISKAGFVRALASEASDVSDGPAYSASSFEEPAADFRRPIIERLVARPFREAAFAEAVKTAYGNTCAMTGLRIVNGGGRSEVQAAHIRPVHREGPDAIRNGLALSGTMHWMFDRGLISISDDLTLLVASAGVPDAIGRMLNPSRRLRDPDRPELRPLPTFLKFHRENVFKG